MRQGPLRDLGRKESRDSWQFLIKWCGHFPMIVTSNCDTSS